MDDPAFAQLQLITDALRSASSSEASVREEATACLQSFQLSRGFLASLLSVVGSREQVDTRIRTQAVLLFKNALDKAWRRAAGGESLDPQSKGLIRSKLLQLVEEEDRTIARTLAFCVGRIARMDYDSNWPDLFATLLATMEQALSALQEAGSHFRARLVLQRCLMYYQQAVKKLSENRMTRGKQIIGKLAEVSFGPLNHIHRSFFRSAMDELSSPGLPIHASSTKPDNLSISFLTFKILAKLVVYGWGGHSNTAEKKSDFLEEQTAFFSNTIADFSALISIRKQRLLRMAEGSPGCSQTMIELLNKQIKGFGKFHRALLMQNHHVFHSLGATRQLTQICWNEVQLGSENMLQDLSNETPFAIYPEPFLVQCLLFVKSCFTQYLTADPSFKSSTFAATCVEIIVSRLSLLRPSDLQRWNDDPEEWIKSEEDDQKWNYDLRPCGQAFLKDLLREYTDTVTPLFLGYMQQVAGPINFQQILLKEAVYTALGQSSTELSKVIPFRQWLESSLLPEAQGTDKSSLILRRRIAWLVGNWVAVDSSDDTQIKINQLLAHLLSKNASTDFAVRLTAAIAISQCDSWEVDVKTFLPFLEGTMRGIAGLLGECQLPESHQRLSSILGVVISRVGKDISPHLNLLLELLPQLWSSAQNDDTFKMSIVVMLKKLVEALETDSQVLQNVICQFIQIGCNPDSPSFGVLQEDGLDLWHSMLKFSEAPTNESMLLAPLAVALLQGGTDLLPKALRLVESYTLLSPQTFLSEHLFTVFMHVSSLLSSLDDKAARPLLSTVDLLVQASPVGLWAAALDQTDAFAAIVGVIQSDATATVITRYLCTLARLATLSGEVFMQLISSAAVKIGVGQEHLFKNILKQWHDRYDNTTYPSQRKMLALGLTSIVRTANPIALDSIDEIIGVWLSAMSETQENLQGESVTSHDMPNSSPASALPSSSICLTTSSLVPLEGAGNGNGCEDDCYYFSKHEGHAIWGCDSSQQSRSGSSSIVSPSPSPLWSAYEEEHGNSNCSSIAGMMDEGDAWDEKTMVADGGFNVSLTTPYYPVHGTCDAVPNYGYSHNLHESNNDAFAPDDHDDNHNDKHNDNHDDDDDNDHSYSADIYYVTEGQDENFDLGWGEVIGNPGIKRLHELVRRDPVHSLKLTEVILQAMQMAQELTGGPESFQHKYLSEVDPNVLKEFSDYAFGLAKGGD